MILRVTLDINVPAANKESAEALLRYHLSQVFPNASVVQVEKAPAQHQPNVFIRECNEHKR